MTSTHYSDLFRPDRLHILRKVEQKPINEYCVIVTIFGLQGSTDYVSPLRDQTIQENITMRVRVDKEHAKAIHDIPVSKSDVRFFPFPFRGDDSGNTPGMVC